MTKWIQIYTKKQGFNKQEFSAPIDTITAFPTRHAC